MYHYDKYKIFIFTEKSFDFFYKKDYIFNLNPQENNNFKKNKISSLKLEI